MSAGTLISVEEYLRTSYSPDMEYVDGELVEINVGEWDHSIIQRNIVGTFFVKYPQVFAVPEIRSKTRETRYRLPDVAVLLKRPGTRVLLQAPFIAIEILSEEDRVTRLVEKLKEYAALGTPNIWVFDPRLKQMFTFHDNALREVMVDTIATENPRLELTREEIFRDLD
jgi:Uma2 family endonuclease